MACRAASVRISGMVILSLMHRKSVDLLFAATHITVYWAACLAVGSAIEGLLVAVFLTAPLARKAGPASTNYGSFLTFYTFTLRET